jgi:hypothetical protein
VAGEVRSTHEVSGDWRIHLRSVSGAQPIFSATDVFADNSESWLGLVSLTSPIARSRTSGENSRVPWFPFSQLLEPPGNPGRFTCSSGARPATVAATLREGRLLVGPPKKIEAKSQSKQHPPSGSVVAAPGFIGLRVTQWSKHHTSCRL